MTRKAFIISLNRSPERRKKAVDEARLCGLDVEVVEAVDARDYKDGDTVLWEKLRKDHPFTNERWGEPFKASEVCIFASHLKAYHRIVEQKLSGAFVFEDDWCLTGQADFGLWEVQEALLETAGWAHCMLHHEHLHFNSAYKVIAQPHPRLWQVRQTPLIGMAYAASSWFARHFIKHYSVMDAPHDHTQCRISQSPHLLFLQSTQAICASSGFPSTQE